MKKLLVTNLIAASLAVFSAGLAPATAVAQINVASDISQDTSNAIISLMSQWNNALTEVNSEELVSLYVPEDRDYVQQIIRGRTRAVGTGVDVRSIEKASADTFSVKFVRFWGGVRPGRANVSVEVARVGDKFLLKVPARQKELLSQRTVPAAVTAVPDSNKAKVEEIASPSAGDSAAKTGQSTSQIPAAPSATNPIVNVAPTSSDGLTSMLVVTTDTKPRVTEPVAKSATTATAPAAPSVTAAPSVPPAASAPAAAPASSATAPVISSSVSSDQVRLGADVDQQTANNLLGLISKWNDAIGEGDVPGLVALHIAEDKEAVEKVAGARGKSVDSKVNVTSIEKTAENQFRIRVVRSWGGNRSGKATNILNAVKNGNQYLLRVSSAPMAKAAVAPATNNGAASTVGAATAAPSTAPVVASAVTTNTPSVAPIVEAPAKTTPPATAAPAKSPVSVAPIAAATPAAANTAQPSASTTAASTTAVAAAVTAPAAPVTAAPVTAAAPAPVASAQSAPASTPPVTPAASTPASSPVAAAQAASADQKTSAAPQTPGSVISIGDEVRYVFAKVGHATLIKLPIATKRVAIGDPNILDFKMISPRELYVLGKSVGTTNMILWDAAGDSIVLPAAVNVDLEPLSASIRASLPQEQDIKISSIAGSVVLSGTISDGLAAKTALDLSSAFIANLNRQIEAAGKQQSSANQPSQSVSALRVIDLLRLRDSQQVMLDVRIAEVSKDLLEQLGLSGVSTNRATGGNVFYSLISGFPLAGEKPNTGGAPSGTLRFTSQGGSIVEIKAEKRDSLIKILAEPSIVAMSGQEGSFLAGGTIFLPAGVSSGGIPGQPIEKEFGVSLKFVPTVLDGGRINLRVAPEVSELAPTITPGTNLPSFTTRKVSTSVQLRSGQSLLIGGLLKSNVTEAVSAFPILGELPIIGALFRSSDFAAKKTELVIFVSPSLVKATETKPEAPTDSFVPPSRAEFFLQGSMEKR